MNTQQQIKNMISWVANVPPTQICPSTSLREDLNLDSIDFMLLIIKLEKWFNVFLTNEEIENIDTVKDISEYITQRAIA